MTGVKQPDHVEFGGMGQIGQKRQQPECHDQNGASMNQNQLFEVAAVLTGNGQEKQGKKSGAQKGVAMTKADDGQKYRAGRDRPVFLNGPVKKPQPQNGQ